MNENWERIVRVIAVAVLCVVSGLFVFISLIVTGGTVWYLAR